jgi:hypothetical protein
LTASASPDIGHKTKSEATFTEYFLMATDEKKSIKNLRALGIITILISAFVSFILSVTVDMTNYELGALINFIWPPFVGLMTILNHNVDYKRQNA